MPIALARMALVAVEYDDQGQVLRTAHVHSFDDDTVTGVYVDSQGGRSVVHIPRQGIDVLAPPNGGPEPEWLDPPPPPEDPNAPALQGGL